MSTYMDPAISTIGVTHSKEHALIDARNVIKELGQTITVKPFTESTVERGIYNTVKKSDNSGITSFSLSAFPVIFSPTAKQLEDSGIREETQVLIKTSVLEWQENGYTIQTLREIDSVRLQIVIDGDTYEIRDKNLDSQYADTFLYIHLGLNKI